jgi:hypothetical protein
MGVFMGDAINHIQHEFWRPPVQVASDAATTQDLGETCPRCATEFIVGSRYCHSCGCLRPGVNVESSLARLPGLAELAAVGERMGLAIAAFIAFLVGVFCLFGALTVGIVFGAKSLLDWQAIQLWRIEWLLAAIAAFVAGVLLRKSKSS